MHFGENHLKKQPPQPPYIFCVQSLLMAWSYIRASRKFVNNEIRLLKS